MRKEAIFADKFIFYLRISLEILDWPVEDLTLALYETITENFKIRSDVFAQPMFSNYRTLALDELFMKVLKT